MQLVAAPLVSRIGLCCATAGLAADGIDRVVAATCHQRPPQQQQPASQQPTSAATTAQLQPGADGGADTVVYAVTASGWLFAGSMAGRPYSLAWQGQAARGGSAASLHTGALRFNPGRERYELLLVQPGGWQVLHSTGLQAGTGFPAGWAVAGACLPASQSLPLLLVPFSAAWRRQQQQQQQQQQQPGNGAPVSAAATNQDLGQRRAVTFATPFAQGDPGSAATTSSSSSSGSAYRGSGKIDDSGSSWDPRMDEEGDDLEEPSEGESPVGSGAFGALRDGSGRSPGGGPDAAPRAPLAGGLLLNEQADASGSNSSSEAVVIWDVAGSCSVYNLGRGSSSSGDGVGVKPELLRSWPLLTKPARSPAAGWLSSVHPHPPVLLVHALGSGGFVAAAMPQGSSSGNSSASGAGATSCLMHSSGGGGRSSSSYGDQISGSSSNSAQLVLTAVHSNDSSMLQGTWAAPWSCVDCVQQQHDVHADGSDQHAAGAHAGCKRRLQEQLAAAEPAVEVAQDQDAGAEGGLRPKQPRLDASSSARAGDWGHADAHRPATPISRPADGRAGVDRPHVTHALLLGSDQLGVLQVGMCGADGGVSFQALAEYCMPQPHGDRACSSGGGSGAAVGHGHAGPVTCALEVQFKCPPMDLVVPFLQARQGHHRGPQAATQQSWGLGSTAAAAAASGSRQSLDTAWSGGGGAPAGSSAAASREGSRRPSFGDVSAAAPHPGGSSYPPRLSRASSAADSDGGSMATTTAAVAGSVGASHASSPMQFEPCMPCVFGMEGVRGRPLQGGQIPLLLTGGADGGVVAWDLRTGRLGEKWMSVHPHTTPVLAIVLPPVHARLPWSSCVISVAEDGCLGLSCLALGQCVRVFSGFAHGVPQQVAWSVSRGLIAASAQDAGGQLHMQAWDVYSGHPDRRCSGAQAHMLMAQLSHEASSSLRLQQQQEQEVAAAAAKQQQDEQARVAAAAAVGVDLTASSTSSRPPALSVPDGGAGSKGGPASCSAVAAVFAPRLRRMEHSNGPIRQLEQPDPRLLLLDVDVALLLSNIAAVRAVRPPPPSPSSSSLHSHPHRHSHPHLHLHHLHFHHLHTTGMSSHGGSSVSLGTSAGDAEASGPHHHDTSHPHPHHPPSHGAHQQASAAGAKAQWQRQVASVREAAVGLALLHRWGLDGDADFKLASLLADLGLTAASHALASGAHAAAGDPWWASVPQCGVCAAAAGCQQGLGAAASDLELQLAGFSDAGCSFASTLCQEAAVFEGGALAVGLPYRVRGQSAAQLSQLHAAAGGAAGSDGEGGGAERMGALFMSNPGVLAVRCVDLRQGLCSFLGYD